MNQRTIEFNGIVRWGSVLTLVLTSVVIVLNSVNGGIAKEPIFVIGALFAVALFSVQSILNGKMHLPFSPIHVVIAFHVLLFISSALWSFDPVYTWSALGFGISCLIFFRLGVRAFATKDELFSLFDSLEWVTLFLCLVGALQWLIPDKLPANFYLVSHSRVPSLLGNSAFFSSYLVIVFPIVLGRALYRRSVNERATFQHAVLGVAGLLLLSTQTRSSIAGWLVSVSLFVLLTWRMQKAKRIILAIGALLAAVAVYSIVLHPELDERLSTAFRQNPESTWARRAYFWNAGKKAFAASPLVGHGTGSYEKAVFTYRTPDYWMVGSEDVVPHAHNEIIEIATEYGVIGLALAAAFLVLTLRRGYAQTRHPEEWKRWISAGLVCSLVGVAIDNLANVSLRQAPIAALTWLVAGLVWSTVFTGRPERTVTIPLRLPGFTAAIPLLLWIGFVVVYSTGELRKIDSAQKLMKGIVDEGTYPESAIGEYRTSVIENPFNLVARSNLTRVLLSSGRWDEAVNAVEDLQKVSPLYPKSNLMKAYALLRMKRYPEALESIQIELGRRSHPEAFWVQAGAYHAMSNEDGERGAIVHLLKIDIETGNPFVYPEACQRLVDIARTPTERGEAIDLLGSVENNVADSTGFFKRLRSQLVSGQ